MIAATILNLFRGEHDAVVKPGDFFAPAEPETAEPADPDAHLRAMRLKVVMLNALFGGEDLRERR